MDIRKGTESGRHCRILIRNQMRSTISDDMTNTTSGLGVGHVFQMAF